MEWYEALFFLLGMILFFMFLGMPVAIAFLAANMIGATYFMGGSGSLATQASRGQDSKTSNWSRQLNALVPVLVVIFAGNYRS